MSQQVEKHGGIRTFIIIAIGQFVSLLGTGLTNFAISVWVLLRTGSVTQFGLLLLIVTLPGFFVTPIAGASADRWNRRWLMILSEEGAAVGTLAMAVMFFIGEPSVWLIAVALAISSICGSFRAPAYLASVPLMVPKDQLGRANGIMQLGEGLGKLLAPLLAGVLLVTIGIQGIILIDFATFLVGVTTLLLVRIPNPPKRSEVDDKPKKAGLLKEAIEGWVFVKTSPGLLALLFFFTFISFLMSMAEVLVPPMLLASTSPAIAGTVVSIFGCGLLAGSILLSTWKGPKRRIHGVYIFALVLAGAFAFAGSLPSVIIMTIGLFLWTFSIPLVNGYMRVVYQTKTPLEMQGRVFATGSMFVQATAPIALVISGPLADRVFTPMFLEGGALAGSVGRVIGVGNGRGIAFMLILMGACVVIGTAIAYLNPRLRLIETEMPDALPDSKKKPVTESSPTSVEATPTYFATPDAQVS